MKLRIQQRAIVLSLYEPEHGAVGLACGSETLDTRSLGSGGNSGEDHEVNASCRYDTEPISASEKLSGARHSNRCLRRRHCSRLWR